MVRQDGEDIDGEVFEQAVRKAIEAPDLGRSEKMTLQNILLSRKLYKALVHEGKELPSYDQWMGELLKEGMTGDSAEIFDAVNEAMKQYAVVSPGIPDRKPGR